MNDCMRGCITECDFEEADRCFPGIARFYRDLPCKPKTFLELVWAFLDAGRTCADDNAPRQSSTQQPSTR
jgi:hypothetical protein